MGPGHSVERGWKIFLASLHPSIPSLLFSGTSRLRWEVLEASANKGGNSQEDNFLPKMHLQILYGEADLMSDLFRWIDELKYIETIVFQNKKRIQCIYVSVFLCIYVSMYLCI